MKDIYIFNSSCLPYSLPLFLSPQKTEMTFDPQAYNKGMQVEGVRGRDVLDTLPLSLSTC